MDLTVEEGQRLKVIYGSCSGFHAVDVDSGAVYDIYLPTHVCMTALVVGFKSSSGRSSFILCVSSDSDQHSVSRHHHSAQHGRYRAAGVLWRWGRVCQHVWTHHQRRGAPVGRDAHICRYVRDATIIHLNNSSHDMTWPDYPDQSTFTLLWCNCSTVRHAHTLNTTECVVSSWHQSNTRVIKSLSPAAHADRSAQRCLLSDKANIWNAVTQGSM